MTKQDEKILMLEVDIDVLTIKLERQERLSKHLKKQLSIDIVSGSFSDGYNKGFEDGLEHRTLKCKCGKK